MLSPLQRPKAGRKKVARSVAFQAPTAGWVSENYITAENPLTALILENWVPSLGKVSARNGYEIKQNIGAAVRTLFSFEDGFEKKLLGANDVGEIWRVDEVPVLLGSGYRNGDWQGIMMSNGADVHRAILVNGSDGIVTYDGATLTNEVYAGASENLIDVTNHQGRVWVIEKGSTMAYYGPPLSNQPPTLTDFPVGPFLRRGGELVCVDTLTHDGGSGPDDYLVFVTSNGEIIIFKGTDPGSDFALVGVFRSSKPMSPRSLGKMGGDLAYYSDFGPQKLSSLLASFEGIGDKSIPIQPEFQKAASRGRGLFGWEFCSYTNLSWIIFNIPVVAPTQYEQYVMNVDTEAWFKITGWNALTFVQHDHKLFFGDSKGNICQADSGFSDAGKEIICDFMQTWLTYGSNNNKQWTIAEFTVKADASPSIAVDMAVDYDSRLPMNRPSIPNAVLVSPWNVSPWDASPWSGSATFYLSKVALSGLGYVGALRYVSSVNEGVHELYGFRVSFEEGAFL